MTGFFDSVFKRSKGQVIRDNAAQGKEGEENIKRSYEWSGYKVKRTGHGHDYKATKRDWFTGRKETKYIEVKTGNSKLSPLQKKKKHSLGSKYVVERAQTNPFSSVGTDLFGSSKSKSTRKTKKKRKTTKKLSPRIFDSSGVDIFGFSSTSKPKRKRTKRGTTKRKRKSRKKNSDPFGLGNIGF